MSCGLGVAMCMNNSGQGCALATRMVVHADIYDEVLERLATFVGMVPFGDPTDPANMVGPDHPPGTARAHRGTGRPRRRRRCANHRRRQACRQGRQGLLVPADRRRRRRRERRDRAERGVRPSADRRPLRRRRRRGRPRRQQQPLRIVRLRAVPRRGSRLASRQPAEGRHGEHQQLVLPRPPTPRSAATASAVSVSSTARTASVTTCRSRQSPARRRIEERFHET